VVMADESPAMAYVLSASMSAVSSFVSSTCRNTHRGKTACWQHFFFAQGARILHMLSFDKYFFNQILTSQSLS
jgi:hypothetical protein